MRLFEEVTDDNFILYAARNYYNPRCIDADEFYEDLKKFKYIKRLVNRYENHGEISERLLLNHLTILFNVFGIHSGLKMLEYKLGLERWHIVKPFLLFLKVISEHDYVEIHMDAGIVETLREIQREGL